MTELRVVIADDESMARARMQRLLSGVSGVELVATCERGEQVLEVLDQERVDLLLLDIRMPGLSGTEVVELLGTHGPEVVFVTAHAEHAAHAFEQGVTDYLLKPVDRRRLELALERVRARRPEVQPPSDRLTLPTARGLVFVPTASITWCGIEGESVVVHGTTRRFTDLRLADLERRLPPCFCRVHRRALVNLDRVTELEDIDSGGYLAHLDDGSVVEVSRAAARRLRKRFLRL